MLPTTQEEIDEVTEYFQWQAPDLEVTFLQKVYSESVIGHHHDVGTSTPTRIGGG